MNRLIILGFKINWIIILLFFTGCGPKKATDTLEYHLTFVIAKGGQKLNEEQKRLILDLRVNDEFLYPDENSLVVHAATWEKISLIKSSSVGNFLNAKKSENSLERKLNQLELTPGFSKPSVSFAIDSLMAYLEVLGTTPIIIGLPYDPASVKDSVVKIGEKFEVYWAKNKEDFIRYINTKVPKGAGSFELVLLQGISPELIGGKAESNTLASIQPVDNDPVTPTTNRPEIKKRNVIESEIKRLRAQVKVLKEELIKVKSQQQAVDPSKDLNQLFVQLTELLKEHDELSSQIRTNPDINAIQGLVNSMLNQLKQTKKEVERTFNELKVAMRKLSNLHAQLECTFTFRKIPRISKLQEHDYPGNGKGISQIAVYCKINENEYAEEGSRNLYVQFVSPDGNPTFVKGSIFQNGESLNYTLTENAIIQKTGSEVKFVFENPDKETLESGTWKVKVFDENRKIGETQFKVK